MKKLLFFITLFIIWLFLTWPFSPFSFPDIGAGLVVVFLTLLFLKPLPGGSHKLVEVNRYYWGLVYIPVLLYYMVRANFDVLYRVLHPDMPINPGIVTVKTELKDPIARAILCNSITLTPGTLSVDIIEDKIYVHWINITEDSIDTISQRISGRFEELLVRIFE